jgi:peptidoglycan/LPS O-acetylase OafA/YrhL
MAGAVAVMVHRGLLDSWWRLYGPDARADGLLLGCALAVIWKAGHLRLPSWVAPCCLAIFIADVLTLARSNAATYGVTVATVSGALVVGSLISNPDSRTARALAYRPLCWVGLISYSLYIWQPLVVSSSGVGGMPMLAISFVIAFGSYKLIEEPFRRRRRSQSAEPALRPAEALAGPVMESA